MTPSIAPASALPAGTLHVPVAIVGAGACGLVTALSLRNAGIDCVVLERDPQPSGSTALSSGLIPACGTRMQLALGIEDSVALFASDIAGKTHGTAAPHLVQAYTRAVGPAIDMLAERHGLDFHVQEGFLFPSHSVLRMHSVRKKTGAALVGYLERAAQAAGADIVTEATVRTLWVDDTQRVHGISFERPDGSVEHLACEALMLACNGFGGNAAMVRELLPEMRDAPFAGHTGNDGSAIARGRALGARLADLGAYQGHGSWATPHGALVSWAMVMEGAIQINVHGERFHRETDGYSEAAVKVLAQPGGVAWYVMDDPLLALARSFADFVAAEAAGALKTCADAAELARLIGGADPEVVARSVAGAPKRPLTAPFHVVKVTGALFHTQGGLDIDDHCRVLREDGRPFPNLLAAGGAARGVSGNAVWGYMSGNGLLSAVGGGAVAAATIVEMLPS